MNKFELSPVTKTFQKQFNHVQGKTDLHFIVGVSGGPDSMALFYLLHRFGIPATAVHCNYGLRGEHSDNDQELVENMSALWGFDCISVKLEPDKRSINNFQEWARKERYRIFFDLKYELNASHIVTAHHKNDQLETILQKVLRGSGVSGWKGIQVIDNDLFRPLLHVSKQEIMNFVESFHVPYRLDRSNEESTYARNFLRNVWFPNLDKLFPGWQKNLLELTKRANEFELMTESLMSVIIIDDECFSRTLFLQQHKEIQPVLLKTILEKWHPEISLSKGFLSQLNSLKFLQTGKGIDISKEFEIMRDRDLFVLRKKQSLSNVHYTITLKDVRNGLDLDSVQFSIEEKPDNFQNEYLVLALDTLKFPLIYRNWKDGDNFKPLGMKGHQRISDHLTNRKISANRKETVKVLESFDGTIDAVIFPQDYQGNNIGTISHRSRCKEQTKETLIIQKLYT